MIHDDHEEDDNHRAASMPGQRSLRIEPHEAPVSGFPKQPSRKDGLGVMCTEHWRAYVKGLREAREGAKAADQETSVEAATAEPNAA
jgi:hypothetical protein